MAKHSPLCSGTILGFDVEIEAKPPNFFANLAIPSIKQILFIVLSITGLVANAQDTSLKLSFGPFVFTDRFQPDFNFIYHFPDEKDEQLYENHKSLIAQQPTPQNYELYFSLACSLWNLEKLPEAERMFLNIVSSKEKFYVATHHHSSDVPHETLKKTYGYGNFTSNYKNYAAIYLTKIYLEQKKHHKALQFLKDAVNKYPVTYTCGTGFYRQKDEYDFLHASCYEGLNRHQDVINLLLPSCLSRSDELIIAAIRKVYSKKEIQAFLRKAEVSIEYSPDTFSTYVYQATHPTSRKQGTDKIEYRFGSATTMLFNRRINIPLPATGSDKDITKKTLVALLKDSDFYIRLKEDTK